MKLSHLKIDSKIVPEFVLLPSDPGKVDLIGKLLKNFKILGQNREFRTGIGTYNGLRIMVVSTGIGCPSVAIAVTELINAGAKTLIRTGTCGGAWRKEIKNGSYIIPTSSIRDEGTTIEYTPAGFPAVADLEVVTALRDTGKKLEQKNKVYVGINRTHDAFYGTQSSITKWGDYLKDDQWKGFDTPILSSEMECSALFVLASLMGVRAGAILLANAEPEPLLDRIQDKKQLVVTESSESMTKKNFVLMIEVVLCAIESLNKKTSIENMTEEHKARVGL